MILSQYKRILVLAAHPDDEVLGCGGTIKKLAGNSTDIAICIVANGLTARRNTPAEEIEQLLTVHHERARRAGALLGAKQVRLLGFGDQKLDTIALLELTQAIETEIEAFRPDLIFTQHGGDLNLDHNLLFRATMTATRPMKGSPVKALLAYPVASSTEWSFGQFAPRFTPNVFVDIAAQMEEKIAAIAIYESEVREFPHPRSPDSMRAAAAFWGSQAGLEAAEPFHLIWTAC